MRLIYKINFHLDGLNQTLARLQDTAPLMAEIGGVMMRSVDRNFKEGGRPTPWLPSKRAQQTGRGKTLIDSGSLRASIHMETNATSALVGTDKVYAAIHNFGGQINKSVLVRPHQRTITMAFGKLLAKPKRITTKGHTMRINTVIPQREFMLLQPADLRIITRITEDHVSP